MTIFLFSLNILALDDFCNQPNTFQCPDDAQCIPSRWRCDTINDCLSGQDELACPDVERVDMSEPRGDVIITSTGYPIGYPDNANQVSCTCL